MPYRVMFLILAYRPELFSMLYVTTYFLVFSRLNLWVMKAITWIVKLDPLE